MQLPFKNTASQYAVLYVVDATTGGPLTGIASDITGYVAKDTGSNTALNTPNPTEVGNGLYRFTLTQAETNADLLQFSATSTNADARIAPLVTATSSATPSVNVVQISGDTVAADNAEAFFDGTGYAGTNNTIPTTTTVTNVVSANVTQLNGSSTIDSLTPVQLARLILSFVAAKASGGGSTPVIFRDVGDTKDRITMTVDSTGNRTSVTIDAT